MSRQNNETSAKRRYQYGVLVLISLALFLTASLDQSTRDALKVQHVLKAIEKHKPGDKGSRYVTEKELNAYICYRLKQEKDTLIRRFAVQLMGADRVRGSLRLDAGRLNLGTFFGDVLDINFIGQVVTRGSFARLDLEALSLNDLAVQPFVLDMVLKAASMYYGQEVSGLDDWYALPKGVDRVRVDKGKAVLFYL